jgi:chemotaxis protein MotB
LGASKLNRFEGRKATEDHSGDEIWLLSYADLVTLLLGFFALLLSFSTMDASKLEKVKQSATEVFGGEYKVPFEDLANKMKQAIAAEGMSNQVMFKQTEDGIEVSFRGALFFNSGAAQIKPQAAKLLSQVIPVIKEQAGRFGVVIEGHTDNIAVKSGPYPTNWELSSVRACSVLRMFEEAGFDKKILQAIGWGDTKPITSNATPQGRSQNRRVVVRIVKR